MSEDCLLCGESLEIGKTNLEHYVPATLIRSFAKLGVPASWDWAGRINQSYADQNEDRICRPVSKHKEWATVRVHERCNLAASPMCVDLKRIIDRQHVQPSDLETAKIRNYYGRLWDAGSESVRCRFVQSASTGEAGLVYGPGFLRVGRLAIWVDKDLSVGGAEQHSIFLGTRSAMEKLG